MARIDPACAKEQLLRMGREWYQHASGQLPAYEWNFDDVNSGRDIFGGGFLSMDNIGVFDRDQPLPGGGELEQSDGTNWMALFGVTMLSMAVELARHDPCCAPSGTTTIIFRAIRTGAIAFPSMSIFTGTTAPGSAPATRWGGRR
jgi:hypothetical protein